MAYESIIVRRGGSNLNYKVVGGTSAPSSPSNNTIWVNTSTAITSHVFSATKPTSPSAGMVWFEVNTSSPAPINARKDKNVLYIYPVNCMQYVSSAWVAKTAKVYQDGAWNDFGLIVLDDGVINQSLGGLPEAVNEGFESFTITSDGALSVYTQALETAVNGYAFFPNAVDLTPYSRVEITAKGEGHGTNKAIYFIVNATKAAASAASIAISTNTSAKTTYTLDISNITGSKYLGFYGKGAANYDNVGAEVFDIRLY